MRRRVIVLGILLPAIVSVAAYLYIIYRVLLFPDPEVGEFIRTHDAASAKLCQRIFGADYDPDVIMRGGAAGTWGVFPVYRHTMFAACESWDDGIEFSERGRIFGGAYDQEPKWDVIIMVRAGFPFRSFEGVMYGRNVATGISPGIAGSSIVAPDQDEWIKSGVIVVIDQSVIWPPQPPMVNISTLLEPHRPHVAPIRPIWHLVLINYVILYVICNLVVFGPWLAYTRVLAYWRRRDAKCVQCGYMLMREQQEKCPECGRDICS